jgi:tetratricopeptide (TPR) repeat protein
MACNANGMQEETRTILERVTAAVPEDTAAQRLLASLYVEAGDTASAIRSYTTLLDFMPGDTQSMALLEKLQGADTGEQAHAVPPPEPVVCEEKTVEEVQEIEDVVYDLSEDDIVYDEEEEDVEEEVEPVAFHAADVSPPVHHDPLSTLTLAELYEQQGFVAKALDIYRTVLADDPANQQLQDKISQLEQQESVAGDLPEPAEATVFADEQAPIAPVEFEDVSFPLESPFIATPVPEDSVITEAEPLAVSAFEGLPSPVAVQDFSPLVHNQADNVVGTLDSWLENIRRIKACR